MSRANARQISELQARIDRLAPVEALVEGLTRSMALTWQLHNQEADNSRIIRDSNENRD